MCLLGVQDGEEDEESQPGLIHEEKREQDCHVHEDRVVLVDQHEHECGTDSERESTDSGHADEHLENQLMGTGDSVGVLQLE